MPRAKKVCSSRTVCRSSLVDLIVSATEYSVLLLGLDNAGKTTLLSAIKSIFLPTAPSIASKTVPTVGQNVATVPLPEMYLKIWDVGGQHSLRRLWQSYYRSCHAIVFVVDSTDIGDGNGGDDDFENVGAHATDEDGDAGFGTARRARAPGFGTMDPGSEANDAAPTAAQRHAGRLPECRLVLESVLASADASGVPILVLANKQDLEDCVETVRIKEGLVRPVFEGERGTVVRDSRVLPVSALTGAGVKEAVEWIRSRVKWNREARPPVMR